MSDIAKELDQAGFFSLREQFDAGAVDVLIQDLENTLARSDERGAGLRDLLNRVPAVRELATGRQMRVLVGSIAGGHARVVRGVYFDKQRDANWKVAWHQDLTIAVKRRIEVAGFGAWSMKAGIQHVQPPVSILDNMIAVRVHLDDADESNGCLLVIPGSHKQGRLSPEEIERCRSEFSAVSCVVKKGDVLVMKPLLLHASSVAKRPSHRRVIHLEYCANDLPNGLEWYED
jgi:hypothetical protein